MKEIYLDHLFAKGCLVATEEEPQHALEVLVSLAKQFDIRILSGHGLACEEMIRVAERNLGLYVPPAFYEGFPDSVRNLSIEERLLDQLLHYVQTYGFGDFSTLGHSLLEKEFERKLFNESTRVKSFRIITEAEAYAMLEESAEALLDSSRPLSQQQYELLLSYILDFDHKIKNCACKDTAVRLLLSTRDLAFAHFLKLPDVIRLVEELQYRYYDSTDIKKLNLKNRDRVLLAKVLDILFEDEDPDTIGCFEKKQLWCGLLHHIHYKPRNAEAKEFLSCIRGKENISVSSSFEALMQQGDVVAAASYLARTNGSGAVLRKLNYLLSRCRTEEEVAAILKHARSNNIILLIQLLMQYGSYKATTGRVFKFTKFNKLRTHKETLEEQLSRKSVVPEQLVDTVSKLLRKFLADACREKLGKVYVDAEMKLVALPLQETATMGGVGVLPKGTRIPIEDGKKIRVFTYWEKVNDIDLSAVGVRENGREIVFSWDTGYGEAAASILHSGDQTSGFDGGSEFFDILLPEFKNEHPDVRLLIFCDHVFSELKFNECTCTAGYMLRDEEDSGEIFEPKTVESSFPITCDSRFAYLFALDLEANQLVWLSMAKDSNQNMASRSSFAFLQDYINATKVINLYDFASLLATEVVDRPEDADVVFSSRDLTLPETAEQIRPCDIEKLIALLNL